MIFLIWGLEIAKMNENKACKKYRYPESFILVIGNIRLCFHLSYRQKEGIVKVQVRGFQIIQVIHRLTEEQTS
jgi:hypothetical protein